MLTLVDYWAVWCGPCRALSPVVEEICDELDIELVKINVDEQDTSNAIGGPIGSIPTLRVFGADGSMIGQVIGSKSKAFLVEWLSNLQDAEATG